LALDDVRTEFLAEDLKNVLVLVDDLGARGIRTIIPRQDSLKRAGVSGAGVLKKGNSLHHSNSSTSEIGLRIESIDSVLFDEALVIPKGVLGVVRCPLGLGKRALGKEIVLQVEDKASTSVFKVARYISVDPGDLGRAQSVIEAVGGYEEVVKLLLQSREARKQGLTAGDFSFTRGEHRCRSCSGRGWVIPPSGDERVDALAAHHAHLFLQPCAECSGGRLGPELKEIHYRSKTIVEILRASVDEARVIFQDEERISEMVGVLSEIGLGNLQMGCPTALLRHDERLRVTFVADTSDIRSQGKKRKVTPAIIVVDSPSRMMSDDAIATTGEVFRDLTIQGHTVLCLDNSEQFLNLAECVIELVVRRGPDGRKISYSTQLKEH
jgi:excinuclease ABC subunit A